MRDESPLRVEVGLKAYEIPIDYFGADRGSELAHELITLHLPKIKKAFPHAPADSLLMMCCLSLIEVIQELELERVRRAAPVAGADLHPPPEQLPPPTQARRLAGMLQEVRSTKNGRKLVVLSNEGETPEPAA
ncbi:MAG: hypothetical protein QNJ92_06760 [Alphaproteobacteria bacterium]|nr:hypothetical protein [Alphaproteobacteria bacterium]